MKSLVRSLLLATCIALKLKAGAGQRSVVVWGSEATGPRAVPPDLTEVIQVSTGVRHCAALKSDGTVITWGTFDAGDVEVPQPANLTNVIAISSGKNHVLALKGDGTVVRWGIQHNNRPAMPAGLSNVVAIAGGFDHSIALKADGTVLAWQTLDGVVVPAGLSNITHIAATASGGIALRQDGALVRFEANNVTTNYTSLPGVKKVAGQISSTAYLGLDGTIALPPDADAQLQALTNLFGIKDIDVGDVAVIALRSDGSLTGVRPSANGGELDFPSSISNNVISLSIYERSCIALLGDPLLGQAPFIVVNPSSTTNQAGGTLSLSVAATGTPPLSYQWRKDGVPVPGQIQSTLTMANLSELDAGAYDVIVRGTTVVTSGPPATVTVLGPPQFTGASVVKGVAGIPLAHQLTTTGQATGFFASGLPSGVALDTTSGFLSGAPAYGGNYQATIVATNGFGIASKVITFQVKHRGAVVAWGLNTYGATNVPAGLSNVVAVAGGGFSSLALLNDGTVRQWGDSAQPPNGLTNVVSVSAGFLHYLALKSDGMVVGWGIDAFGETVVPNGVSNLIAAVAGDQHSLALRANGTVIAWGRNDFGQASVPADLTNVVAISARGYSSLAVRSDGTIVRWGSATNTVIPPDLTNAIAIGAGTEHYLALLSDRTVVGWGDTNKLGFPLGLTNVIELSAGNFHSVALASRGPAPGTNIVLVWGQTNGTSGEQYLLPAELSDPSIRVADVAAGYLHSLAVLGEIEPPSIPTIVKQPENQPGHVGNSASFFVSAFGSGPLQYQWWGLNLPLSGKTNATLALTDLQIVQAGPYFVVVSNPFGSVTSSIVSLSVSAAGTPPTITQQPSNAVVTAASNASFSVAATGTSPLSYQWYRGTNFLTGATNASLTLTNVQPNQAGLYTVVVSNQAGSVVSSGAALSILPSASLDGGRIAAWGLDSAGQVSLAPGASNIISIAAGENFTVALKSDGTVMAWGNNFYGQVTGTPNLSTYLLANPVSLGGQVLSNIRSLSARRAHTLALKNDGTVVSWGNGSSGETSVPTGLSGVSAVAAGGLHSVALKSDGTVVAWGGNNQGQSSVPVGLSGVVAIAAGYEHTLALKGDGTIVAWGRNSNYGESTVPSGLGTVTAIAAGEAHNVAIKADGTVTVWGANFFPPNGIPEGLSDVKQISAGADFTLALKTDGSVVAWGFNGYGQTNVPAGLTGVTAVAAGYGHSVALFGASSPGLANIPSISGQPQSQTVVMSSNVTFGVTVSGPGPLSYQWLRNGRALPGASVPSLVFTATNRAMAGSYAVVVTNAYGSTTSSPALLRVLVPQRLDTLERLAGGGFKLRFGDHDGNGLVDSDRTNFVIQYSTNLSGPIVFWLDLTNASPAVIGGKVELDAPGANGSSRRFYRVIER